MMDDDGFDDFVDVCLAGHRVLPIRDVHEGGPEADGQVVGIHHVLVTILREATRKEVLTSHLGKGNLSPCGFFLSRALLNSRRVPCSVLGTAAPAKASGHPLPKEARAEAKRGHPPPPNGQATHWLRKAKRYLMTTITTRGRVMRICWIWCTLSAGFSSSVTQRGFLGGLSSSGSQAANIS